MTQFCHICEKPITESQWVRVQVTAKYHILKSKIVYALDKDGMVAHSESLVHEDCIKGE